MSFTVYLSGEIHTSWREEIQQGAEALRFRYYFHFSGD